MTGGDPNTLSAKLNYWKFFVFKLCNGYFIVVAGGMCAAGVISSTAAKWLLCFIAGSKFLEGLMDQELSKTKDKIESDTQHFVRSQIKP